MHSSTFQLDPRLSGSCIHLDYWSLSTVLLKNSIHYPWLILVPRRNELTEIHQLSQKDRHTLMDEIARLSLIMDDYFKPSKINVASLGNIVPQLHVHVIARFTHDAAWPSGIWQSTMPEEQPYDASAQLIEDLRRLIMSSRVSGQ